MAKMLDCTLRDGGYHNSWDFSEDVAYKTISALAESGVDIVEIGYKSKAKDKFYGLYRYCSESQLQFLKEFDLKYAFMVDVKEFIKSGVLEVDEVKRYIKPERESIFTWCRVATYHYTATQAAQLVSILKTLGYKVTVNIMSFPLLSNKEIDDTIEAINGASPDVIYVADSFGALVPRDIQRNIEAIRRHYSGSIGIHTHDNQGLAFANTIAAIDAGVEYVDASILGMGRGAGNLKLEQILLYMYFKLNNENFNPYALLDVIQGHFIPMHASSQWGWDFSYMLSGLKNIHPIYCQQLKSNHRYTIAQVANILTSIPDKDRIKFSSEKLAEASNAVLRPPSEGRNSLKLPTHKPSKADSVLIVACGPDSEQHKNALRAFIDEHNPLVLECNDTGVLNGISRHRVVLNRVRLAEVYDTIVEVDSVIVGIDDIPKDLYRDNIRSLPCKLESGLFEIHNGEITIPAYIVGMYAVGIALLSDPRNIYLAGFSGFTQGERMDEHRDMQHFWTTLEDAYLANRRLISILPTHYDLDIEPIYAHLS